MSRRGLTAVLAVTALLITARVKPHPAAGYKSFLLPIGPDPGFNRRLSGAQPAARSEGTGSPVEPPPDPGAAVGAVSIGTSTVSLLNGPFVSISIRPPTHPLGILKSLPLPLPEEIKASRSAGGHVAAGWAGSVSSWALRLPCKAPSVRLFLCCGRAVGGDAGGKINNY